ncbi:UMP-CMP kinase isoform X2 [Brienomyrus brachyistius]|uniref:UMP-CMP kinase isoform X2 n=1 Tax=Brienomyrus brachyistius TaxID=42636 RepID=UPI0020B42711|nr:UMP-CMP kinase isoform X2 [Brienomyrus brachyistius]
MRPLERAKSTQDKGLHLRESPLFSLPVGWIRRDVNGCLNCRISSLPRSNRVYGFISDYIRIVSRGRVSFVASRVSGVCFTFAGMSEGSASVLCQVSAAMKPQVVFVLGGPGAGKGTQCAKIVQNYNYTHLSAGDLLREERIREGSECGQLIDSYIKEGKIVPVEITITLLKQAMEKIMQQDQEKYNFLIDGFPRNESNLQGWNKDMEGKADVRFILFFDCSNEVCVSRCLERGKNSGRTDDNRESLEKRIQTYLTSTRPIINQYLKQRRVRTVDASRSVEEVFADVKRIFEMEG